MRLFVAARDEAFVREAVARRDEIDPGPSFRRVRPEGYHATFVFLGDVDPGRQDVIATALDATCRLLAPFSLAFDRAGSPGGSRTTRVFAVKGESAAYEQAARGIRRALAFITPPDGRRPVPHVTLGRARDPVAVEERPVVPPLPFAVREITLVESFLEPRGARYEVRHVVPLGASSPGRPPGADRPS